MLHFDENVRIYCYKDTIVYWCIIFFWQGSEKVIHHVNDLFPDMELLSLSGNFCTDKKPAAVNW